MPQPNIYAATEAAVKLTEVKPIEVSGQAYCDMITKSHWWRTNCCRSWMGDRMDPAVPTKVHIESTDLAHSWTDVDRLRNINGQRVPVIHLSTHPIYLDCPADQDPWVILHELAHVWAIEEPGQHGPRFCEGNWGLVWRYLGEDVALEFRDQMKLNRVRAPYRLLK